MTTPRQPQVGERLAHYQLVELLAVGGMGMVYRAYEPALERYVAIKVLAPKLAADEAFARQFLHEARAAANLHHPNITHVYYVGQQEEFLFFAMELVEGENLETLLRKTPQFNVTEATQFIRQAAAGLQHAHAHGLIHGDIKPANLVVTGNAQLKVTDFGLARHTTAEGKTSNFGTPEYASPETSRGQPTDHRSDIYSLGATFYHLLAGRPPFVADTPTKVLHLQETATPQPVRKFNFKVTPALNRIVMKMLAKKPADRYQNYETLIAELDQVLQGRSQPKPDPVAQTPVLVISIVVLLIGILSWYFYTRQRDGLLPGSGVTNGVTHPGQPPSVRTSNVTVTPPVRTELQEEIELRAVRLANTLRSNVQSLIAAGKYGEAYRLYEKWPVDPLHATTKAHEIVMAERAKLEATATADWGKIRQEILAHRDAGRFDEALAGLHAAATVYAGIPSVTRAISSDLKIMEQARRDHEARITTDQQARERAAADTASQIRRQIAPLIASVQWEKATTQLQQVPTDNPLVEFHLASLRRDVKLLANFKQALADRVAKNPTPPVQLMTTNGEVVGQLVHFGPDTLTVRHQLGRDGSAEIRLHWNELTTAGLLRALNAALDDTQPDHLLAYGVCCSHLAVLDRLPLDDAKRVWQAIVRRDPTQAERMAEYIVWMEQQVAESQAQVAAAKREATALALFRQAQAAAARRDWDAAREALWRLADAYRETTFVRQDGRAEIEQLHAQVIAALPARTYTAFDLKDACNVNLISTKDRNSQDWFDANNWFTLATTGWLKKNGQDKAGIPDHGRVPIPDVKPEAFFQMHVGEGNDAIVLSPPTGRYPAPVTWKLPKPVQRRYEKLAFLHASNFAPGTVAVTLKYTQGDDETIQLHLAPWQGAERRRFRRDEENPGVIALECDGATNGNRTRLWAHIVNADSRRVLVSLTFALESAAGVQDPFLAAIFAVSGLPSSFPPAP